METTHHSSLPIPNRVEHLELIVSDMQKRQREQGSLITGLRWSVCVLALVLGVVLVALLFSTPAHADANQFEFDVQEAGFVGASVSTYLEEGHRICVALAEGYSKHAVAEEIYENTKFDNVGDAMQLVNIAHRDLCPGVSA